MLAKITIAIAAAIIWLLIMCCMIVASDEDDRLEEEYWRLIEKELEKSKEDKNDQT